MFFTVSIGRQSNFKIFAKTNTKNIDSLSSSPKKSAPALVVASVIGAPVGYLWTVARKRAWICWHPVKMQRLRWRLRVLEKSIPFVGTLPPLVKVAQQ